MNWYDDPKKKIIHINKHVINLNNTESKDDLKKMQDFFANTSTISEYVNESKKNETALFFNYSLITENIIAQGFDKKNKIFRTGNWYYYTDKNGVECKDFVFENGKEKNTKKRIPKHLMIGCQDHEGELNIHTCFIRNPILGQMAKMNHLEFFLQKYGKQFVTNDETTLMKCSLCKLSRNDNVFETNDALFNESVLKVEELIGGSSIEIDWIDAFLMTYFENLSFDVSKKGERIIYKIMYHKYLEKAFKFKESKIAKYTLTSHEKDVLKKYLIDVRLLASKDSNEINKTVDFHEEFNYVERYLFYRLVNSAISYIGDNELEPIRLKEITILGLDPIEI